MTYELAKSLKDAGFPIKVMEHDFWGQSGFPRCTNCGTTMTVPQFPATCDVRPTLSELIEACGESLKTLFRWHDIKSDKYFGWVASELAPVGEMTYEEYVDSRNKYWKYGRGITPEEAVAKLWLELNKSQ